MIEISTLGNSEFFGDLTQQRRNPGGRVSNGTRGVILGGYHEPVGRDTIDYCTIASASDLDALASGDRNIDALNGWRFEVFGKSALQLCDGKIGLSVKGAKVTTFQI